jgi:hypothetical protein
MLGHAFDMGKRKTSHEEDNAELAAGNICS